ncbi:eukaryotic translation initiation factor 2 subunit 2 isoform X2 [Echeneis naucrates]|uniref:eukaryotic translation initiation factor 2 subunit 2 isoform X2 n=1 Tax=Echeneis naucrates TaxID=173247 RepID=UPI0011140ECD|nr:eukaryotic translation initiation factor 2 subunit 2 isoform X2 [Echeneis naucrates]
MSGDEMIFDPNMTKKKKKKKKPFMVDEDGGEGMGGEEAKEVEAKEAEPETGDDKEIDLDEDEGRKKEPSDDLNDLNFFNQKKKKKKPKKVFDNDVEEGLKELKIEGEQTETLEEDNLDLVLPTKKKKTKKVDFDEGEPLEKDDALEDDEGKNNDGISFSSSTGPAWAGSERDYTYDELLNRVFNIMREKNPDMVAGEKRKFVMKPPQVVRVGTKKTSFVNFTDICKLGSIDGNNQLVIKGRFQQKQIENVLRRYIKEYVTCHTCRSPETILQKDTRLYFLQCETCHSRCSVASIKTGFQAVTGKRAQLRAKAN